MCQTDPKLDAYCHAWKLSNPKHVVLTPRADVYQVQCEHGLAALKLLKPAGYEERIAAVIYKAWNGTHAPILYRQSDDAILLEWLEGPDLSSLVQNGMDDAATEILVDLAISLHLTSFEHITGLTPLHERFRSLFRNSARSPELRYAANLAQDLLDRDTSHALLHGDLHHGNVLRRGSKWVAFDPKGIVGPPAYDLANLFLNPLGHETVVRQKKVIERRSSIIAARLGIAKKDLLQWVAAHCGLSATWSIEDGESAEHALALLDELLRMIET